jgi:hypothetical protein
MNVMQALKDDPCAGKDESTCDNTPECVWCKSAAVPSSCYTKVWCIWLTSHFKLSHSKMAKDPAS